MVPSVLFVASFGYQYGGGEGYLIKVIRHLDRERFRPVVLLPEDGDLRETFEAMGAAVHVVPMRVSNLAHDRPWNRYLLGLGDVVDAVCEIIRTEFIRLVHTNSNERIEGALAATICGIHHVYLAHIARQHVNLYGRLAFHQESFAEIAAGLSSRVVAVSGAVASTLSGAEVQVIHNGIELDEFDDAAVAEQDLRCELGLPADTILASTVGRLCADKGIDVLVESAAGVLAGRENVHFLLIGPEVEEDFVGQVHRRVAELGIGKQVHFLGRRGDVPAMLRQSDIFVLASRIEGHPYALLEAMASNCGIVSTRCPGADETIVDGESGLLVDVDDVDGLAKALDRVVSDAALRQRLAEAANDTVRERFTAKRSAEQLMSVYEQVLAEPAPHGKSAAVDLFLLAAREFGLQEDRILKLQKQVADLEATVDLVRKNPILRSLRGFLQKR